MESTNFCNLHGLARELRLPVRWLRKEADAGRIPCLRIAGRYRFNVEAVRRALAERASIFTKRHGKDGDASDK